MTEVFISMMIFLKGLVRHGAMHLFSGIEKLDMAICIALASLLTKFVRTI